MIAVVEKAERLASGKAAMSFIDQNRRRYVFEVPERVAQELRTGHQGVLTFCGSDFVYFVRKEQLVNRQQRMERVS